MAPNIAKMSPREFVNMGQDNKQLGIEGYFMPIIESPQKPNNWKPGYSIGKQKMPGVIEAEAKRLSKNPGAATYKLNIESDWVV